MQGCVPPTQCLPWHVRTHLNNYSMSVFSVGYRRISRLAHTQDSRALEQLNSSTVSRQPLMGQRRSLPVETSASVTPTPSWYIRHHPSTLAPPSISRASFHVLANIPSLVALHTISRILIIFFSALQTSTTVREPRGAVDITCSSCLSTQQVSFDGLTCVDCPGGVCGCSTGTVNRKWYISTDTFCPKRTSVLFDAILKLPARLVPTCS